MGSLDLYPFYLCAQDVRNPLLKKHNQVPAFPTVFKPNDSHIWPLALVLKTPASLPFWVWSESNRSALIMDDCTLVVSQSPISQA